jgi:hypothetical protein
LGPVQHRRRLHGHAARTFHAVGSLRNDERKGLVLPAAAVAGVNLINNVLILKRTGLVTQHNC